MEIKVNKVQVKDLLSKSNLPASDFVVNPYVGCPHGCKYCYACFMKRFTNHEEEWGTFVDVKECDKPINTKKLEGKSVFLSSVTDCYNQIEEKECVTRRILQQLVGVDTELSISTKSKLILRDLDILKQLKNLTVCMSINTLDENFRADMDNASTIEERLDALKTLHENGIRTVLFMSPMFPEITDYKAIVVKAKDFIDEFWFENLNLRGSYKYPILNYIKKNYRSLWGLYYSIYDNEIRSYWHVLAEEIEQFCQKEKVNYKIYFFHEQIRKNGKDD